MRIAAPLRADPPRKARRDSRRIARSLNLTMIRPFRVCFTTPVSVEHNDASQYGPEALSNRMFTSRTGDALSEFVARPISRFL